MVRLISIAFLSFPPFLDPQIASVKKNCSEQKAKMLRCSLVAPRTCIVSCTDLRGSKHSVEVIADSLYEAVAQGLRAFRDND